MKNFLTKIEPRKYTKNPKNTTRKGGGAGHFERKAGLLPAPKFRTTSQKWERLEDGSAKLPNSGYIQPSAKLASWQAGLQKLRRGVEKIVGKQS